MSKLQIIETSFNAAVRELNKNVPVSRSNMTDMLIIASMLEIAALQIRRRVKAYRERMEPRQHDNDNHVH